ncbi:Lrp/AsnC family transcriptional regulator [Candidatus Bathyarchaeota archaeon]|nr:MAG: Lrp/AsnC family transcriptional regulator [Candidatus Bathyarchaeota archaeon]HDM88991.1 Lrp/AsnC family transcriptional regulator [Candidatus Bathyarchaeota archaeon]
MPTAFVLINTETGFMDEVLKELEKIEGVKEAYTVYGVYDIIAKVEANTMDGIKDIVTWKIRKLSNVRTTLTMIVIEEAK